jgi:hypothetical protein
MQLVIDDRRIPVNFQPGKPVQSGHTRRTLRTGTISFQVADESLQEVLTDALAKARNGQGLTLQDDNGVAITFNVGSSSYSGTNWRPPWRNSIEVTEMELLKPESISIDGVELTPYQYDERPEGDGIAISCKVEVDHATGERLVAKLREHQQGRSYFPVVRHGLEEAAREMRFGQCCWSEHGATSKYELVLVEKVADEAMTGLPLVAEMGNVMRQVARNGSMLESLTDALVQKGVLTSGQVDAIREKVGREEWDGVWALFRLRDIDG